MSASAKRDAKLRRNMLLADELDAARSKREAIEAAGLYNYPDLNSPEPARVEKPDLDIRITKDVGQAAADAIKKGVNKK